MSKICACDHPDCDGVNHPPFNTKAAPMFDLGLDEGPSTVAQNWWLSDHDLYFRCGCQMQYDSQYEMRVWIWTDNCPTHHDDPDWYWLD